MKVFVGYDIREDIAFQVCEYSIHKHQPVAQVIALKQAELRESGVYTRAVDPLSSTEFTFTRFLVPYLADYKGWALFVDCDFVFTADVAELFAKADDRYAVMVVKHDYTPKEGLKMDGCKQLPYPRKNWSSAILWNCAHPANKQMTPDTMTTEVISSETVKHSLTNADDFIKSDTIRPEKKRAHHHIMLTRFYGTE